MRTYTTVDLSFWAMVDDGYEHILYLRDGASGAIPSFLGADEWNVRLQQFLMS